MIFFHAHSIVSGNLLSVKRLSLKFKSWLKRENEKVRVASQAYRTHKGNSKVFIGRYTYGFGNSEVLEWGEGESLHIGSFCSIAKDVVFMLGGEHRLDWISTYPFGHIYGVEMGIPPVQGHPKSRGSIEIGNDVWIGQGAWILSGIRIGDGAVIGAKSVVTKNVLPYSIVAGNPAKEIKLRFTKELIDLLLELKWWNLSVDDIREIVPILTSAPNELVLRDVLKKYAKKP